MATSAEPSLSVATLPRKAIAFGFGTKLIISRFPVDDDDNKPSPYNTTVVDDGQIVRAVSFLRIPDGPLCLVSAGDGKMINVYNVSSKKEENPNVQDSDDDDDDDDVAKKHQAFVSHLSKPSFSYGPHAKRITSLATAEDGSIVFADKFGEVFRLRLAFSPEHTIEVSGDLKTPAVSLMQHLSTLSTLYLSAPVPRLEGVSATEDVHDVEPRRIFTCDKDKHARVSRYPETYNIEQFLWSKRGHQSVVTCIVEVPYLYEEDTHTHTSTSNHKSGNKRNRQNNAPYYYYVTGEASGRVCFWAAHNDVPEGDEEQPFRLITTFHPSLTKTLPQHSYMAHLQAPQQASEPVAADTKDYGSVVSVTYVVLNRTDKCALHPRDYVRGVLVAYEKSDELVYLPLYTMGEYGLHVSPVQQERVKLAHPPVALASTNDCNALALLRDGSIALVGLVQRPDKDRTDEEKKVCTMCGNITADLKVLHWKMSFLEQHIKEVMCQPVAAEAASGATASQGRKKGKAGAPGGGRQQTQLEALDLCAHWRLEPADPRNRERDSDDDNDNDKEVGEATQQSDTVKDGNTKKNKAE